MTRPAPTKSSDYKAFNARLSKRITQVAVTVTLSITFVIGSAAYWLTHSLLKTNITHTLERQLDLLSQRLELNLGAIAREVSSLAATTVVANALLDDSGRTVYLLPLLNSFKLPYDIPFHLVVTDFEGKPVARREEQPHPGYKGEPWVEGVITDETPYAGFETSETSQHLILAYPILFPATGRAEGMLVLEFPLAPMLATKTPLFEKDIVTTLSAKIQQSRNTSVKPLDQTLVSVQRVLNLPTPLDTLALTIRIGKSRETVYQPLRRLAITFGIVATLVVLMVVIIARITAQRITAPLAALSANAQIIAISGKPVSQVNIEGEDEVAALAYAFNKMVTRLHSAQADLEQRVEERTHDLLEAQLAAERANNAKSEFLANMSHEFRTPMHAILSFTSLAMDKLSSAPPEKIHGYLERIHDSGSRLLCFLNDLLDLSKLEAGKMEFGIAQHDVRHLAELVKQELGGVLREKELQLDIQATEISTTAWCDKDRIIQVLSNLLTNAIKFTPSGKSIKIGFQTALLDSGNERIPALEVTVSDEGIGIPDEELPTIFDKFVQSSKTKSGAGGTGLGLAICKEIIEGHEGRIWASSDPFGGAIFRFTLPRIPRETT